MNSHNNSQKITKAFLRNTRFRLQYIECCCKCWIGNVLKTRNF